MEIIDRQKLLRRIERQPDRPIVDVLPEEMFEDYQLPGALNVPLGDDAFDERIQRAVPDKSSPVVVYCHEADRGTSPKAARRMEALGYGSVLDYDAGKKDWKEVGLQVVS